MLLKTTNGKKKHTHLNFQIKSLFVVCLPYISVIPLKYNSDIWRITDDRQLATVGKGPSMFNLLYFVSRIPLRCYKEFKT